jgi:aminoglycoside 3-N-acetyltransferase
MRSTMGYDESEKTPGNSQPGKRSALKRMRDATCVIPAPIAPSAVTDALLSVGIRPGSLVLVHPDAIVAAQFPAMPGEPNEQRLDLLIEAIEAAVGRDGTLVMPTFSYSFAKGERFDIGNTPSAVGMVTERFRTRPGVRRTSDPIFSFASRGPLTEELCAIAVKECFGTESVFAALHRLNAHIVDLGCSMDRGGTFVHYVETAYGVAYRYRKTFSGAIIAESGEAIEGSVVYNVRDLTRRSEADLRRLQKRLADDGKSRSALVGRSRIMSVTAGDLFNTAWKMLDENPRSLIAEGVDN